MTTRRTVTPEEAWGMIQRGSLEGVTISDGFALSSRQLFQDGERTISMTNVVIEGRLSIDNLKVFNVCLDNVTVNEGINMQRTVVAKQWYMKDCHIKTDGLRAAFVQVGERVTWVNVTIDHIAELSGLTVTRPKAVGANGFQVDSLSVNGVLQFVGGRIFDRLLLLQVTVTESFSLKGLTMEGDGVLDLTGLTAKGSVNLSDLKGVRGLYCDRKNANRLHHAAPTVPLVY